MAYQPPLIGFKQLLNFGAYSMPDIGGWIFVAVGVILLGLVIFEWRKKGKPAKPVNGLPLLIIGMLTLSLSGCNTGPQPIQIGKDNCSFCKMTISDNRFGAEIITKKNKVYKFDDAHCIKGFLHQKKISANEIAGVYFTDFNTPHALIAVEQVHLLQSPNLKSPMGGNIAAFSNEDSLVNILPVFPGNKISWEDMQK